MELWSLGVFLLIVFIGSYVQAVAGFAMAMLIVAIVGGLRLLDLPTLGAVVSLLTILNVFIALRGHTHEIHMGIFKWLALGQVPAIFVGLQLLHWLDGTTRWVLELCLGLFIMAGGLSMFLRPHPWQQVSGRFQSFSVGGWRLGGGNVFRQWPGARLVCLQPAAGSSWHSCHIARLFCADHCFTDHSGGS